MKTLLVDKIQRIIKSKAKLEKILNVKIIRRGKEVTVQGKPENEYLAEKVIDALNFGFPFSTAILIKEEGHLFEIMSIKNHTTRKDLDVVKARIIGKKGQTLKTLSQLTKCDFELLDNRVAIIGPPEYMENAQDSLIHLIKGAKQGNVYAYLEKHQVKPVIDLGLKKPKK